MWSQTTHRKRSTLLRDLIDSPWVLFNALLDLQMAFLQKPCRVLLALAFQTLSVGGTLPVLRRDGREAQFFLAQRHVATYSFAHRIVRTARQPHGILTLPGEEIRYDGIIGAAFYARKRKSRKMPSRISMQARPRGRRFLAVGSPGKACRSISPRNCHEGRAALVMHNLYHRSIP